MNPHEIGKIHCSKKFFICLSFKFQVFISQRPQLRYVNKYKQYNIEQNKAMHLKICNNTELNIKHRSTYIYKMYMDMSKYNLGRQPNYYM